jgi:hypothetical protein
MPTVPTPGGKPTLNLAALVKAAQGQKDAPPVVSAAPATDAASVPTAESPAVEESPAVLSETVAAAPVVSVPKPKADDVVSAGNAPPPTPPKDFAVGPNGMPVYLVQLQDNPATKIEAEDRLDAIDRYNAHCGIIGTIHKHDVRRV